jgi:Fe-S oxidoreductase
MCNITRSSWQKPLNSGKLKLSKTVNRRVAYHDPCFLGKRNNIFDEPRQILQVDKRLRTRGNEKDKAKQLSAAVEALEESGLKRRPLKRDHALKGLKKRWN